MNKILIAFCFLLFANVAFSQDVRTVIVHFHSAMPTDTIVWPGDKLNFLYQGDTIKEVFDFTETKMGSIERVIPAYQTQDGICIYNNLITEDEESTIALFNTLVSKLGDPGSGQPTENGTVYVWKKEIRSNTRVITLTVNSEKNHASLVGVLN